MFGDDWPEDHWAPALKGGQRASLVRLHEPAIADEISGQFGGEATAGVLV
jgi:hypothetical protein